MILHTHSDCEVTSKLLASASLPMFVVSAFMYKGRFTIYVTRHSVGIIAQLYVRIDLSSIPVTLLRRDASMFTYIVNPP